MENKIKPLVVKKEMTNEQADVLGVIGFSFAMNGKLTTTRNAGKGDWHKMDTIDPLTKKDNTIDRFKEDAIKAIKENRFDDAGNYCMMMYHRDKGIE